MMHEGMSASGDPSPTADCGPTAWVGGPECRALLAALAVLAAPVSHLHTATHRAVVAEPRPHDPTASSNRRVFVFVSSYVGPLCVRRVPYLAASSHSWCRWNKQARFTSVVPNADSPLHGLRVVFKYFFLQNAEDSPTWVAGGRAHGLPVMVGANAAGVLLALWEWWLRAGPRGMALKGSGAQMPHQEIHQTARKFTTQRPMFEI